MDLYEYQARDIFESYQVPVLPGIVIRKPEEARTAAEKLGGTVVVKAQVKTGGRGKAGGVKLAKNPSQALKQAQNILGMDVKGHTVRRLMISPSADIVEEYYFSLVLNRSTRTYLAMCSLEGGMDIEQLAVERPEALIKVSIDPLTGVDINVAEDIAAAAGFAPMDKVAVAAVFVKLWEAFKGEDATLVEVNPLVKTKSGEIIALDGKITLDDNAQFRHQEHSRLVDKGAVNLLESKAESKGLNYVKLDGQIGIIGNGAGLVMSTLDVTASAGQRYGNVKPANFLDIGGGASAEVMAAGLNVILEDPQVRSVFVNVFGGITSCDAVATGIVQAMDILDKTADKPIVVRLDGNSVAEGREILTAADHPLIIQAETMDEGADKAAELAHAR